MPAFENLNFLCKAPWFPRKREEGVVGALTAVAAPGQSQFCSVEMILFPWRLLKDAFNFFLFLPFKIPFYFIITIFFFAPGGTEKGRKKKTNKAITKC